MPKELYFNQGGMQLYHSVTDDPQDKNFPLHMHDHYEILCLVSGNVEYIVEGHIYSLPAGAMMLMRSSEAHKLIVKGAGRYDRYTLHFRPEFLLGIGLSEKFIEPFTNRPLGQRNRYLPEQFEGTSPVRFFEQICRNYRKSGEKSAIVSGLADLLCCIYTAYCGVPADLSDDERGTEQILMDYVNEHICSDLSVKEVADRVHMSYSQLTRVFRRLTGTSLYDYVLSKRLILAQEKINMGIGAQEASQSCGFKDYSSFYRLYKKRTGSSPSQKKQG